MKILCIGDSLTLPGHGNRCEDTWFYKLQNTFKEDCFFSFFRRAITTNVLSIEGGGDGIFPSGADCLEFYLPDIVIMQLGIVDCVPRLFKENSVILKILRLAPEALRLFIISVIKKVKKRSLDNAYVSLDKFEKNLFDYIKRCERTNTKRVIFIKICMPDSKFIAKNPTVIAAINLYNNIFDELERKFKMVITVNPLKSNTEEIYEDGYHPNSKGNELVFQCLKNALLSE